MKKSLPKTEHLMPEEPDFNFDLARMEERINDRFFECPRNLKTAEEIRNWLLTVTNDD